MNSDISLCILYRTAKLDTNLLIQWAESNQTCYMTSPRGKGVREQHFLIPPFGTLLAKLAQSVVILRWRAID